MSTQNELITRNLRVHPHAPKKGYRVRVYNVYGIPFAEERGWYQISFRKDQFEMLKMIRNEVDNPDSKPVFDICTDEEKRELIAAEKRAAESQGEHPQIATVNLDKAENDARYLEDRSRGRNTVDLTTRDLPRTESAEDRGDVRDLAPPVPPAPANAIDGAAPAKPKRGRPPKVKAVEPSVME